MKIRDLFKRRKEFIDGLSNNGEFLNLGEKREIVTGKDIDDGEIYYRIGDKEYRIPAFKVYIESKAEEGFYIPLEKRSENKYLILDAQMDIGDKHTMLKHMLDRVLMYINIMLEDTPNQELKDKKDNLCRSAIDLEYFTKKMCSENRIEEANQKLIEKIEEVLMFDEEMRESDREI